MKELIVQGDPRLHIQLPAITVQLLQASAKKNKRRVQDQFIKTLAQSFRNNEAFIPVLIKYVPDLKDVYQKK